jgi:hypothetical protein
MPVADADARIDALPRRCAASEVLKVASHSAAAEARARRIAVGSFKRERRRTNANAAVRAQDDDRRVPDASPSDDARPIERFRAAAAR